MRDIGRTLENRPDDANRRLSSWGGGLRTVLGDSLQLDLEAAHRVVRQPDGAATDPLRETVVLFRSLVKF
jgi:hemolysin activation/secretion protein